MVKTNGKIVWSGEYDAFGNCQEIKPEVGGIDNPLRFPGQYYDKETGLYYNLNRYYDPKIGRYLQTDPAGDSLNPYVYAAANPVNAIDPDGLCAARMVFGIGEAALGYGILHSGVGAFVGGLMMMNGIDEAVAGFWGIWSGQPTQSALERAIHTAIPNQSVASWVHFGTQVAISAGPGLATLGGRTKHFIQYNRVAAYAFARGSEFISNFTPKTWWFDARLYNDYLQADSILLGRFYGKIGLDVFGQWYVPQSTILQGKIGFGKHLVRNIQRAIDRTGHIYIRTEGIFEGLDKLSFTYRHELGYILKNKQLINKTMTLAEDGTELSLEIWAKGKGLLK